MAGNATGVLEQSSAEARRMGVCQSSGQAIAAKLRVDYERSGGKVTPNLEQGADLVAAEYSHSSLEAIDVVLKRFIDFCEEDGSPRSVFFAESVGPGRAECYRGVSRPFVSCYHDIWCYGATIREHYQ